MYNKNTEKLFIYIYICKAQVVQIITVFSPTVISSGTLCVNMRIPSYIDNPSHCRMSGIPTPHTLTACSTSPITLSRGKTKKDPLLKLYKFPHFGGFISIDETQWPTKY